MAGVGGLTDELASGPAARERILDAAAGVMREQGVANATTKQIARAAGYSEALLYKHFRDKEEILIHVLKERMPPFVTGTVPGERTVEANLVTVAHGALRFYRQAFPMMVSMMGRPRLMGAVRDSLAKYGAGPQQPVVAIAGYVKGEQDLGRIPVDVDADAVAALLIGACFQQAFFRVFVDGPDFPESAAVDLVRPLLPLLRA